MSPDPENKPDNKKIRLEEVHPFKFNCSKEISCYTQCCRDITIVLTPYDVLRLKTGLEISSGEFLDKYTHMIPQKDRLIPLVILKMNETDKKCSLVSDEGCTVYSDRPWPCRMFPLDLNEDGTYSLISDNSRCLGLNEDNIRKISDWLEEQGIKPYEEMNEFLSSLTIQLQSHQLDVTNPKIQQMIMMALYNIDKFREFVFNSTFLDRLEVEKDILDKITDSDHDLLKFAYEWLKFGLFGKKVFWVKEKPKD